MDGRKDGLRFALLMAGTALAALTRIMPADGLATIYDPVSVTSTGSGTMVAELSQQFYRP
jgi:hypothetical protein